MLAPKIEAVINNKPILGCLVDEGAAINILANWLLNCLEMDIIQPFLMRMKGIDQQCIKILG